MTDYDVTITEVSQMTVSIRKDSRAEAEEIAEIKWKNGDYILDADHFKSVSFKAKERVRSKDLER